MERLDQAKTRLDQAIGRLEAAQQALDDRVRVLKAAVTPGTDWQELIRAVETVQHPALAHMAASKPFAAIPGRLWTCETPFVAEAAERLARLRAEVERRR